MFEPILVLGLVVLLGGLWILFTVKRKIIPALIFGVATFVIVLFRVQLNNYIRFHYIKHFLSDIPGYATKSISNGNTEKFARAFQNAGPINTTNDEMLDTLRILVKELREASVSSQHEDSNRPADAVD